MPLFLNICFSVSLSQEKKTYYKKIIKDELDEYKVFTKDKALSLQYNLILNIFTLLAVPFSCSFKL